jgi:hypothetical protein
MAVPLTWLDQLGRADTECFFLEVPESDDVRRAQAGRQHGKHEHGDLLG